MSWKRPNLRLALLPAAPGAEHADIGRCSQRGSRDSRSRRLVLCLEPKPHLIFIKIPVKRLHGSQSGIYQGRRSTSDDYVDPLVEG
jgi:hypothetical protein